MMDDERAGGAADGSDVDVGRAGADLVSRLQARAGALGFSLFGVTDPGVSPHTDLYRSWLGGDLHGEMAYLSRDDSIARRGDLKSTMESVRSVVVVAHEYYAEDPREATADPGRAIVARYARGQDYHEVVTDKLLDLLGWLEGEVEGGVTGRAYVDTGPILERDLAQRAGLGWFGRNTMLINPRRGSYFFIGVLLLDLELPKCEPFEEDRCGSCHACLEACPTRALLGRDGDGAPIIDARRCISYLTIELRGPIPHELRPAIGNRVFGCDICQEVCPWNERFAAPSVEPAYVPRPELDGPRLIGLAERLLGLSGKGFGREFAGSPVLRTGRKGLLRSVCVALGNWESEEAVPTLVAALSDAAPLVRGHAAWALGRVGSARALEALSSRREEEANSSVIAEMDLASGR